MTHPATYPIGTPGVPWGATEVAVWLARQTIERSYETDVLNVVDSLRDRYDVLQYGRLDHAPDRYPLVALQSRPWNDALPLVLITGGVHGYETSGVLGALRFLQHEAADFADRCNLLVAPCVSPWAYEVVGRWNPHAVDPNRSFRGDCAAQESAALMNLVAPFRDRVRLHIDLHETTDSDEEEFRPALAARDGKPYEPCIIPDGFYLVADSADPRTAFQQAILDAVARVTHIAAADAHGQLIGSPILRPGLIAYPLRSLGLCAGMTQAPYRTTTEVYPDSPRTTPEQCVQAQVTAVRAALEFALRDGR